MKSKVVNVAETIVIVVILLVLIQTFLEDLVVLLGWDFNLRKNLIYSGFAFDLFFTIEFLVRLYFAISKKKIRHYFIEQRGWIDFMASIPLLMFNSGPALLALFAKGTVFAAFGGILNVLKVIKAIRIARILRFLRVIKIFKNIKYAESPMAQRHVARITSLSVTTVVIVLFVFITVLGFLPTGLDAQYYASMEKTANYLYTKSQKSTTQFDTLLNEIHNLDNRILKIKTAGSSYNFHNLNPQQINNVFGPEDYQYLSHGNGNFEIYFDLRPYNQQQSVGNLIYFFIIVIIVFAFLFIYSPHFALTISDPIHVMKRGLEDNKYNLQVKVLKQYEEDDVFQLSELYNEKYLPLKDRTIAQGEQTDTELKIEDIDLQGMGQEEI